MLCVRGDFPFLMRKEIKNMTIYLYDNVIMI